MYEYTWHHRQGKPPYVTVTPIKVVSNEDGVITATDHKDRLFKGYLDQYFKTEEEAKEAAKRELLRLIIVYQRDVANLQEKIASLQACLKGMDEEPA